jgi:hypothetical protein
MRKDIDKLIEGKESKRLRAGAVVEETGFVGLKMSFNKERLEYYVRIDHCGDQQKEYYDSKRKARSRFFELKEELGLD